MIAFEKTENIDNSVSISLKNIALYEHIRIEGYGENQLYRRI